jgi:diguanylate cyclase (GGDEF)-like protein
MDTRTQLAVEVAKLREEITALRKEARTDKLTQLGNRRFADERLEHECAQRRPCALILIDIDHFKRVNDEHGHDVGDVVLQSVARVLQSSVRASDDVCRLGGEEFLVICPNTTADAAVELADRLRSIVGFTRIEQLGRAVTVGAGITETTTLDGGPSVALKRANAALYAAKRGGRNRVLAA